MADAALTRVAVAVTAVEATVLVVAGVVLLLRSGDSYGLGTGGLALALGVVVAGLALALHRGSPRARSPVIVIQLMALPIGVGLLQASNVAAGLAVLVVALGTGWAVLAS